MILISACLLGIRCRYDGKVLKLSRKKQQLINQLIEKEIVIPICPEQLGGLSTPRRPAKVKNNKVITDVGVNVTTNFHQGARESLKIARLFRSKTAYLKSRSPSCGKYGITAQCLRKAQIRVCFI